MKITTAFSLGFLLGTSYLTGAMAQQVNGTLGSPSATTTIDGKQLPPPPPKFGGVINETADSRGIEDLVAAACGATQGRAQRAAHHDRRPRLRCERYVRGRYSDAGA